MKKSLFIFSVTLLVLSFLMNNDATAQDRKVKWDAFSKNLIVALASDNEGLKLSAMGMIIRYGDSLDVGDATFDVIRVFKFNKNPRVRRLAAVTLHKIGQPYGMYFLKRQIQFEKDECVRKHCCCMVNDYYARLNEQDAQKELVLLTPEK